MKQTRRRKNKVRDAKLQALAVAGATAKEIAEAYPSVSVDNVYKICAGMFVRSKPKPKYSSTYMLNRIGFDYARAKQNELV